MKQLKTIDQLKSMFPNVTGIEAALLYGSFGRNEANPNSDIDIQLLVSKSFETDALTDHLQKLFLSEIQAVYTIALRNKIVVYLKLQPKIEFAICTSLSEIDRNYLGSEIPDWKSTILFERQVQDLNLAAYLEKRIQDYNERKTSGQEQQQINDLICKFIYEFESCSGMHRRSDSYQFYFYYNIALHLAVQLSHISKGQTRFNFLPKRFSTLLTPEEQKTLKELKGSLFLPEANQQKRKLLDFFYTSIKTLVTAERSEEVKQFCEWVYNRDYLWNFRDISTHNPKIKSGKIFRTSSMTFIQDKDRLNDLLTTSNIKTVIDLRADKEIEESPYTEETLSKLKYVKAQFDPWTQPEWFKQNHAQGTDVEIAYRFFALACNDKIKTAIEGILSEDLGAVAIHCAAGKDRTGILISILHLLAETPLETVYADFLASEYDVELNNLVLVLDIINQQGGIVPYLYSCGLTEGQISKLKQKLIA